MLFLIGLSLISVFAVLIAMYKSKKPINVILAEAKYDLLYNLEGSKSLWQDFIMKDDNKVELSSKSGRIAVITGGTKGIGLEVVKMLLKCDMTVVIACRNVVKGEELLGTFRKDGITTGQLDVYNLDISVLDSVKKFTTIVKEKYPKIHYLINNAGIMFGPFVESKDGFESQFATNYLGHFFLTHLLLPQLKAGGEKNSVSRIINVSSTAHNVLKEFKVEDISQRKFYIPGEAYAQSKLAQILFTLYLNEYLRNEKCYVQVYAVHPGVVNTDLFNNSSFKSTLPWAPGLLFKNVEDGAIPIVYACLSTKLEEHGGAYMSNCKILPPSEVTNSLELQKKMFDFSNELLNIKKFGEDK